jgi:tetraacyldisaccharide 4'-kinase
MARDIEVVVVDGSRGVGNGLLLPAGPLREPVERLAEVDWVVSNGEPSNLYENETVMTMVPDGFYNLASNQYCDIDAFVRRNQEVHAVCGIGNPNRFFAALQRLGLNTIKHVYKDHHDFSGEEVLFADGLTVVCTEKDAAKLKHIEENFSNVWFLRVSVQMPQAATEHLLSLLAERAIVPRRVADAV